MKAFVINEDQVKQYILALIGALVLAFFLGYVLGNRSLERLVNSTPITPPPSAAQSAPDTQDAGDEQQAEETQSADEQKAAEQEKQKQAQKALEEKKLAEKKLAEKKLAEKKLAEKKAAEKRAAQKKLAEKKAAERKRAEEKRLAEKKAAEARKLAEQKAAEEKQAKEKAEQEAAAKQATDNTTGEQASTGSTAAGQPVETNTAAANQRYYSVQAGMFASRTNALSFIEKLAEKNFEAHVTDFVSSSGATKYNVRVGRFEERNQARELLREFQKNFSSPAYVVITQQ